MIIGIYVLAFIFICVILEFNLFINLKNKIKHSKSTIDIYLTQRFDLIPNLIECVKGYAKYEKETLSEIARLREAYNASKDLQAGQDLNGRMIDLMARVEESPDLKASEQFIMLEKSLTRIENQLQAARRIYNGDVTLYNTTIESFPHNIAAAMFNMKQEKLFIIEEYKAKNIEVNI